MGVLIDSNLLIVLEREKKDIQKFIASREDEEMFLSVISVSELLHGVHRATTPAIRNVRGAFVESLIRMIPVLDIQSSTARIHADLWASMAKKGTMIDSSFMNAMFTSRWAFSMILAASATLIVGAR